MSSEIRVNKINNRAGLGTVTYTDTGIIVSGVSTASNFKTGTSDLHSAGLNVAYADVDDFVDVGNIIKLGNAGVVTATTFSTANVDVTTDKIVVGTGVTIEANQVATGQATFTGIVTASSFRGDGSQLTGVGIDTSQLDVNKLDVSGISTFKNTVNLISPTGDNPTIRAIDGNDKLTLRSNGLLFYNQNGWKGLESTGSSIKLYNGQMASHTLVFETTYTGVKVGTGVTLETNGQATYTGIVTASSFKLSDGSAVGGVTSDSDHNTLGGTNAGGNFNTSGDMPTGNTLFGKNAGDELTYHDYSTAIGYDALKSGSYNTAVGYQALMNNTGNTGNTAIGVQALRSCTTGSAMVAVGYGALYSTTSGAEMNVAVGNGAMQSLTTGDFSVALGNSANYGSTTSSNNTAIGYQSLFVSNSGNNTALGYWAGRSVSGTDNTLIGAQSGMSGSNNLTSGSNNTLIGHDAAASSATVSNEVTLGDANIDKFRVPGLGLEFAKDHTYGITGGRKNWFDNGSFDCIGGRRANTSMDYGNHHAYGWVTDRFQSRNSVQWTRSSNVPAGKGFSYSTQTNGVGGRLVQAVELPDYGDMGVFAPGSYWCVSVWSTAGVNQSGNAFSYDLGSTKTDIPIVHPSSGGVYQSTGETASGTSTGTFTRYYAVFQMPNSIISTATSAYWTWAFTAAGYHTGFQLERVPTATSKPTPYEHVHPSVTTARCRRYAYQIVNSRLVMGYVRHDGSCNWQLQHPVPPTHMPSGSNQSVDPYGVHLHDAGIITNFQSILQNPGLNNANRTEFDYRSGQFILYGSTSWSSTHTYIPSWESQEIEFTHGHF